MQEDKKQRYLGRTTLRDKSESTLAHNNMDTNGGRGGDLRDR